MMPLVLNIITHIASKGSYDVNTGLWNIEELLPEESVTLQITVTVVHVLEI